MAFQKLEIAFRDTNLHLACHELRYNNINGLQQFLGDRSDVYIKNMKRFVIVFFLLIVISIDSLLVFPGVAGSRRDKIFLLPVPTH